jgi:hypothetical protein
MTSKHIAGRIDALSRGEFQNAEFIRETYGFTDVGFETVASSLGRWAKHRRLRVQHEDRWSRWTLEAHCVAMQIFPPRSAAYQLGITLDSLAAVLDYARESLGVPHHRLGADGAFVSADFVRELPSHFKALHRRVFSDHTSACKALHGALGAAKVKVTPVFDETSELLADRPPLLGRFVDVVSLSAVSSKYGVWIGRDKPISLEPDRITMAVYVEHENALRQLLPEYKTPAEPLLARIRSALKNR